jgi:flagellar biogenesis protein FliO
MTDLYLQICIALPVVLGSIYLLGLFLKKRQAKDGLMKIMGYQSLGPKKGLAMVKIGKEGILLAITATDIKLLKTFENNIEEQETGTAPETGDCSPRPDFTDPFKKLKALKDRLICR